MARRLYSALAPAVAVGMTLGCSINTEKEHDYAVYDAQMAPESDRADAEVLLKRDEGINGHLYLRDIQVRCSTEKDEGTNTEFSSFSAQILWHGVIKACVDNVIEHSELPALGEEVREAYTSNP